MSVDPEDTSFTLSVLLRLLRETIRAPRQPIDPDPDAPLSGFGMDSLAAAQFQFAVEHTLGVRIPFERLLSEASLRDLSEEFWDTQGKYVQSKTFAYTREPESKRSYGPLSFAQERLWRLLNRDLRTSRFNLGSVYRLRGRFNIDVLRQSFDSVVARQGILRTTVKTSYDRPIQWVAPHEGIEIAIVDFREIATPLGRHEVLRRAMQVIQEPFNLESDIPIRVALFRAGEGEHYLVCASHRMACDGWSIRLFANELAASYSAYSAGTVPVLPILPKDYVQYAIEERTRASKGVYDCHLGYWADTLHCGGMDFRVSDSMTNVYAGANVGIPIDAELYDQVEEFSSLHGATPSVVFMTAVHAALSSLTRKPEVAVGYAHANRIERDYESTMGLFSNTLIVDSHIDASMNVLDLFTQIRSKMAQAYNHIQAPFSWAALRLSTQDRPRTRPYFGVKFELVEAYPSTLSLPFLKCKLMGIWNAHERFDLDIKIVASTMKRHLSVTYNSALIEREKAVRILRMMIRVVEDLVQNVTISRTVGGPRSETSSDSSTGRDETKYSSLS